MLAQLLIQFQKPIITENALQNATNQLTNATFEAQLDNSTIERAIRSIPSDSETTINRDVDNLVKKERFIAPDYSSNGKAVYLGNNSLSVQMIV